MKQSVNRPDGSEHQSTSPINAAHELCACYRLNAMSDNLYTMSDEFIDDNDDDSEDSFDTGFFFRKDEELKEGSSSEVAGIGSSQLWWRAYKAWIEQPVGNIRSTRLLSLLDSNNLWIQDSSLSFAERNRCITKFCTQHGLFSDTEGRFSQVIGILKTVSSSIGFGSGNIAWASLALVTSMVS